MPWNQPGPGNDKDPWGQGSGGQKPPDLDEVFRNLQRKLNSLFGGRGRSGGGGGGGLPSTNLPGKGMASVLGAIAVILWTASGFYIVEQAEQAVELRFGRYQEIKDAGLRWHLPWPIETVAITNIQKINTVEVGYRTNARTQQLTTVPREALMLTADENIIDIQFAVQYDIKDPRDLIFHVSESPETVVRGATESTVREIVGRNTMDFAITAGRAEIALETQSLLQQVLDRYQTGINIRTVEMQNAQPPAEVKAAFDDAVKAREDQERLKNEGETYANDIIPRARGQAARIIEEAEGYRASVIARAEGAASRFTQVLQEYQNAPEVTRDRLYIETIEDVMSKTVKLVIDQPRGGNNVMYLPLDQLMRRQGVSTTLNQDMSRTFDSFAQSSRGGDDESQDGALREPRRTGPRTGRFEQ
jgi:membrane protease subunit HflK